jgi:hypothetical protein
VHDEVRISLIEGLKEGKAEDVVPVEVSKEEMEGVHVLLAEELLPEVTYARAAVEDHDSAVGEAHLDADGVATVTRGLRAGDGDGAADSVELDSHMGELSANSVETYTPPRRFARLLIRITTSPTIPRTTATEDREPSFPRVALHPPFAAAMA